MIKSGRKNFCYCIAVFFAICFVCGCQKTQSEDYQLIVDHFKEMVIQQDEDSAAFDQVLETTGVYIKDSTEDHLKEAREAVQKQIDAFSEESESYEVMEMDDDFLKLLDEYGIDAAEYKVVAEMGNVELSSYIDSLTVLKYYLDAETEGDLLRETLEFIYEQDVAIQEYTRRFYFCQINYFFAEWDEELTAYVKDTIMTDLKSFWFDDMKWETDKKTIEDKAMIYTNQIAEELDKLMDDIGRHQEELYQMEKEAVIE
ncbi:hypothetical protein [Clostridium sp. AM58-1XD]|uniref:hypothetical protein n=1 Tax=Clostridium sp. AM58-1XD TaxID=2292307 RepID=UPI000E53C21D|nr:hypothetical protein [Clostridium sp. AM58-1XD]RGZ01897.1 hypothetical protein DXA13_00925 [Clostridium sp. AM58-1XD]